MTFQALTRQGLSIDEVVAQTGLSPDFVQRFAEPVLAEMDFVIQRARRLAIYAAGQQIPVEDLVDRAAREADVPTEDLQWSCRKVEDATWRIDAGVDTGDVLGLIFRVSEGTVTLPMRTPRAYSRGGQSGRPHRIVRFPLASPLGLRNTLQPAAAARSAHVEPATSINE